MVIEGVNVDVLVGWLVGYTRFYLKVLGFFLLLKGNERRC